MLKSRFQRTLFSLLITVSGIAVALALSRVHDAQLTDRATRIPVSGEVETHAYWLTSDDLLVLAASENRNSESWNWIGKVVSWSRTTGQIRALPGLTRTIQHFGGYADWVQPSPDGQRIVWHRKPAIVAFYSAGSLVSGFEGRRWDSPQQGNDSTGYVVRDWFDDSRYIEINVASGLIYLRDMASASRDTVKSIASKDGRTLIAAYVKSSPFDVQLSRSNDNGTPLARNELRIAKVPRSREISALRSNGSVRLRVLTFAKWGDWRECSVARNRDRIVHLCHRTEISPLISMLSRVFPQYKAPPNDVFSIWISNYAGDYVQLIGQQTMPLGRQMGGLVISPDGNSVSFTIDNDVYVLPLPLH